MGGQCRLASKWFCRIADNDLAGCDIAGNHGARTNDCSAAYFKSWQYHGAGTNEGMFVNMHLASKARTWADMYSVFEYASMIDRRRRIHND